MSMDKIAVMAFQSVHGRNYEIEIYKRDTPGVMYELTPAVNAFETQEDNSDDPMEPLRGSTGYVRFMYRGELNEDGEPIFLDLIPKEATEMMVILREPLRSTEPIQATELLDTVEDQATEPLDTVEATGPKVEIEQAGTVVWMGFVKPAQYSQRYDTEVREIAVPVVSVLEVMKAVEMDAENVQQPASWRELLVEAVQKLGVKFQSVVVPYEWGTKDFGTIEVVVPGVKDFDFCAPLVAMVSRWVWAELTDAKNTDDPDWREVECKTYGDIMADWCRFWGWTMRERGDRLYLVSRRARTYCRVQWSSMVSDEVLKEEKPTAENIVRAQSIELGDDVLDGTGHTLAILPAVRSVEVAADTHEIDTQVLELDGEKMEFAAIADGKIRHEINHQGLYSNAHGVLYGPNSYSEIKAWSYTQDQVWEEQTEEAWENIKYLFDSYGGFTDCPELVSVGWGKVDFWKMGTDPDKKNYYYKEGVIVNNAVARRSTWRDDYEQPILEIKSKKSGIWREGYFVIDPSVIISTPEIKDVLEATGLMLQLEIGPNKNGYTNKWFGYYWGTRSTKTVVHDGESVTVPPSFVVPLHFEGSRVPADWDLSNGETPDMKTLDMDCNGARGYIIAIDKTLEGRMTLRVLSGTGNGAFHRPFVIDRLSVEYYPIETEGERKREAVNRYYTQTGAGGTETKKIGLQMATENNNNPGHGVLIVNNVVAKGATFRTPGAEGGAEPARPEEVLLATAREAYGRRMLKLEMEVTLDGREEPTDTVRRPEWGETLHPVAEKIEWADDRRTVTLVD